MVPAGDLLNRHHFRILQRQMQRRLRSIFTLSRNPHISSLTPASLPHAPATVNVGSEMNPMFIRRIPHCDDTLRTMSPRYLIGLIVLFVSLPLVARQADPGPSLNRGAKEQRVQQLVSLGIERTFLSAESQQLSLPSSWWPISGHNLPTGLQSCFYRAFRFGLLIPHGN